MLDALRLGSYDILFRETPRHAAVNEWVNVVKYSHRQLSGLVNAVLRKVRLLSNLSLATRYGLPDWLFDDWIKLFGQEHAEAIAQGMAEAEPLWLHSYHPQAEQSLVAEGCQVTSGPLKNILAVRPGKPLAQLEAFKRGWVQPQNPSSTLAAQLLVPKEGERILDLASGNGIKAAQLAAAGAQPLSIDLHETKLRRAAQNLKRLGFKAGSLVHDLRTVPDIPPVKKVLLDAPCTGTGTLRGNPELRTKVTAEDVAKLASLQSSLLETAAALTASAGLLVYAVCALTEKEGVGVIRSFLSRHPEFEPMPFSSELSSVTMPEGCYILPVSGLDGFFIARLRRLPDS